MKWWLHAVACAFLLSGYDGGLTTGASEASLVSEVHPGQSILGHAKTNQILFTMEESDGPNEKVQAVRDYIYGVTDKKPKVGRDWKKIRDALENWSYSKTTNAGDERSHAVTLINGFEPTFFYYIPKNYDPSKQTPLIFFLHGGVFTDQPKIGERQWSYWKEVADEKGWIACSPSGHRKSVWWTPNGEDQILKALRFLSAGYNIDRNRVFLSGFSDGASGVYGVGMKLTDYWAGCIPWNGSLRSIYWIGLGQMPFYTLNCKNTTWRATHGELDKGFPALREKPYIDIMTEAGVSVDWKNFTKVGHNPEKIIRQDMAYASQWAERQARNPFPDQVDWIAHDPERYGQAFWVRILSINDDKENPFEKEKDFTFEVVGDGVDPDLGIKVEQVDIKKSKKRMVKIKEVTAGTGAEDAGLKLEDVLISVDGQAIESEQDLLKLLKERKSFATLKFEVKRNKKALSLDVLYRPTTKDWKVLQSIRPAGRLRATREGQTIKILTQRVEELEILISPEMFDLKKQIQVEINGKISFKGKVKASSAFMVDEMKRRSGDTQAYYVASIKLKTNSD